MYDFNDYDYEAMMARKNNDYMSIVLTNEALDRLWYLNIDRSPEALAELETDEREWILRESENVRKKYDLDNIEMDDFYKGYWTGIRVLSQWLSGSYGDDPNDISSVKNAIDAGIFEI